METRVLVTGANGQLGKDIVQEFRNGGYSVIACEKKDLDITNLDNVKKVLSIEKPHIIIHAAAYTAVDEAEQKPDLAYLVNAYGTRNVAVIAESIGAKLVYISTDYVFNGQAIEPMNEFHPTDPINIYGKSKLAGENFVRDFHSKYFIVRTSWLYGQHGNNFVKTMLNLAKNNNQISVVNDQFGCPTYTLDLVHFLIELVNTDKFGIYHASNTGLCSWYDFAKAVFEEAMLNIQVNPVSTNDFPRPAPRPRYSVLDHMGIRLNNLQEIKHWRNSLNNFIKLS